MPFSTTDPTHTWLSLQCSILPNVRSAILGLGDSTPFNIAATWPTAPGDPPGDPSVDDANHGPREDDVQVGRLLNAGEQALARKTPVALVHRDGDIRRMVLGVPLVKEGQCLGVLALELPALNEAQRRSVVQLISWGAGWLDLVLKHDAPTALANRLGIVLGAVTTSLERGSFDASAIAVVTHLAHVLRCERVSLGLSTRPKTHDGKGLRVVAVSDTAKIDRRTNLMRDLADVMRESITEGAVIVSDGANEQSAATLFEAHRAMSQAHGLAVCSAPLTSEERVFGSLVFERNVSVPFDADAAALCDACAAALGPLLLLKRDAERAWRLPGVGKRSLADAPSRFSPARIAVAATLGLVLASLFIPGEHRVTGDATIKGSVHHALAAPIEGYIQTEHVRAGDVVSKGDVLATLDDQDLQLERRRLQSERVELKNEHRKAVATGARAKARIIEAQIGKIKAQVALLDEQLRRTELTAPFDGFVVSGDLSHARGAPVKRGEVLYELAPLENYRVVLRIDEFDIDYVLPGQRGNLALSSMPDRKLGFTVQQVMGIAQAGDGKNTFRVDAEVTATTARQLRPGMNGVGKIAIGERSLWWIWTHQLREKASLWLWGRLP
ncbi:MAG: HlyD family efflux transporter periplasmic adaptor subunit [Pseudomonadota bacterium]